MQVVFPSKIDATSVAPILVSGFGALAASDVIAGSTMQAKWIIVALVLLVLIGFPVWILTSTYYTFTSNELVIRCGPLSWNIPFRDIMVVQRSTSARSAPALSMDRIRIDYGQGQLILISPYDSEAFLEELYSRRNEISRRNQALQ